VLDWCRARLANYKMPKHLTVLDRLPRTPVDKVDRMTLAARAQAAAAARAEEGPA